MENNQALHFAMMADEIIRTYPFKPLDNMRGKFAHMNFCWRKYDNLEYKSELLTLCLKKMEIAGENQIEISDFFANYLRATTEGYREEYLDTVFGSANMH